MIERMKIYLAGHSEETRYRETVKNNYNRLLDLIDPMEIRIYDLDEHYGVEKHVYIVRRDQKLILTSDILVAYINIGSTFGTTMEIAYAKSNNIPVYVIDVTGRYRDDVWLKYHTDKFFDNIASCFNYITGLNF